MIRPRWLHLTLITLIAANVTLAISNSVLLHRTGEIYRHARELMAALPEHACGAVIEPGETCSMTLMIPLPFVPGTPAPRALRFHAP